MISKDMILLNLKRNDLDYSTRAREALLNADEALKRKDGIFVRQLINDFVFPSQHMLNSTQELQLICILLNDFFTRDDPSKLAMFFHIFEIGKNSRKFILLKFILTAIAVKNGPALNAAGTYLLDPQVKDVRLSADLNRLLINEITFFSSNSLDKLKTLPLLSPLFTNALCLIFAETFKEDLPTRVLADLITEFMQFTPSPFIFCFSIPSHVETGAYLIAAFYRWSILSELHEEEPYVYSKFHLKILNEMSNVEMTTKPVVYTKYLENIVDQIQKALLKPKDPERIQRCLEKLAQIIQVSKNYLYGNIPNLMDKLRKLPKNPLLDLVVMMK